MSAFYPIELEEQFNCAFVLSSSLYFRLAVIDPLGTNRGLWGWHGLLHDASRDLSALSEPQMGPGGSIGQLLRGISDLRHALRDLAESAVGAGHGELGDDLRRWADRLDKQIESDSV